MAPDTHQAAAPGTTRGPRGPALTQLPLFSAQMDEFRTLQDALIQLGVAHEDLENRYAALWQEHRALTQALEATQLELHHARVAGRQLLITHLQQHEGRQP